VPWYFRVGSEAGGDGERQDPKTSVNITQKEMLPIHIIDSRFGMK
jgi:hypothetical protein